MSIAQELIALMDATLRENPNVKSCKYWHTLDETEARNALRELLAARKQAQLKKWTVEGVTHYCVELFNYPPPKPMSKEFTIIGAGGRNAADPAAPEAL